MASDLTLKVGSKSYDLTDCEGEAHASKPFVFYCTGDVGLSGPELEGMIGETGELTIRDKFGKEHVYAGRIAGARYLHKDASAEDERNRLEWRLEPAILPLCYGRHTQVFMDKSCQDIVNAVLSDSGAAVKAKWTSAGALPKRPYCLQRNETDWAFIERLLADDGLHYYFDPQSSGDLQISGASSSAPKPHTPELNYRYWGEDAANEAWAQRVRVLRSRRARGVHLDHYDPSAPTSKLAASAKADASAGYSFSYPGGTRSEAKISARAKLRQEAGQWDGVTWEGDALGVSIYAGSQFKLCEYDGKTADASLFVVSVYYSFEARGSVGSTGAKGRCRFRAIPVKVPYRPATKPHHQEAMGMEMGAVVGPKGKEIYSDKDGHAWAKPFWDRETDKTEKATQPIRVSQPQMRDSLVFARTGWEVGSVYVHESPEDRVLLAHVHDGAHPLPYAMPANKTQSALTTPTSKSDGTRSELFFDDRDKSEMFRWHAAKDMNVTIGDNRAVTIGNNRTVKVGKDRKVEVGKDAQLLVGADRNEKVEGDRNLKVDGSHSLTVNGDRKRSVDANQEANVGKDLVEEAKGNRSVKVSKNNKVDVTSDFSREVLEDFAATATMSYEEEVTKELRQRVKGNSSEQTAGMRDVSGKAGVLQVSKGDYAEKIGGAQTISASGNFSDSATNALSYKAGAAVTIMVATLEIEADKEVTLKVGKSAITVKSGEVIIGSSVISNIGATVVESGSKVEHN